MTKQQQVQANSLVVICWCWFAAQTNFIAADIEVVWGRQNSVLHDDIILWFNKV